MSGSPMAASVFIPMRAETLTASAQSDFIGSPWLLLRQEPVRPVVLRPVYSGQVRLRTALRMRTRTEISANPNGGLGAETSRPRNALTIRHGPLTLRYGKASVSF